MNSRKITLIVAVVLAIATGVLTLHYLSINAPAKAPVAVDMRPMIIASTNIPARAKIKPQMLTRVMKPAVEIDPSAVADAKAIEGDVALVAIPAGTTVTQTKVGVPAAIGVTGRLKPGQRAVSIPVDMVKSVSGLIEPGDSVDVMASTTAAAGKAPHTAAIIRGAVVLAVNQSIDAAASDASPSPGGAQPAAPPTTVTLAVSAQQADLLTVADLNATLRLALRSPDESIRSMPAEEPDFNVPAAAAPAAAPPQNSPAPAAAQAKKPIDGVPVIDGDTTKLEAR